MKWKSTLVILAITIALGAYVSLYELKRPSPEIRERLAKQLVRFDPETVQRVTLEASHGAIALVRTDGTWRLEARPPAPADIPAGAGGDGDSRARDPAVRADTALIDGILQDLKDLLITRTLEAGDAPLDPTAYGLEPAKARIVVATSEEALTVLFGETTAVGNHRYVKRADVPEIHVVTDGLYDTIDEPRDTFRDHQLVRFNSWETTEVVVKAPTVHVMLQRTEDVWRLIQPLADVADRAEVGGLLSRLAGLQIQRFVTDVPGDTPLATWGLDQPTTEVTVVQPNDARITLRFGAPLADDAGLVHAQRSDEPSIYAVAAKDVETLQRDPHGLRSTVCLEVFTSEVTKVQHTAGAKMWTIERSDGTWKDSEGAVLDRDRVETWLRTLADLRLAGFIDDAPGDLAPYGLDPSAATIAVWAGTEEPQRLLFGAMVPDTENRYGRIEGRAPVIRLPKEANALLTTSSIEFAAPAERAEESPPAESEESIDNSP
jgi:hypothetical protein